MFWAGLILLVAACIGLSTIGLRNTSFLGTHKSILSDLRPIDIKIAKISGVLFLFALLFFGLGFWFQ
jgi:hypothetical protein